MKKAAVLSILVVVVLLAVIAEAQQPKNVPRLGYLSVSESATDFGWLCLANSRSALWRGGL
jgi:hypothetical protein